MSAVAEPLPVIVIAELLGVPPADHSLFRDWSYRIGRALDLVFEESLISDANRAVVEMRDYFRPLVERRRRKPGDDLLSRLVVAEERGERLSEDELYAFCTLLLFAGSETTTNLIGNGLLSLLHHPHEARRLRAQPSLVDSAIEELLRFESPLQATTRVATESFSLGEREIEAGDTLVLQLGAANRDPDQFDDPDELKIDREPNHHVAFGMGIHYCLGAPLARLEGRVALPMLLERFPRLRLIPGKAPRWRPALNLRGLRRLPVAA